jgi:chromosome segregation ATPase
MSTTYNLESADYEIKISPNGIDSTISNLKSRLFDLEQQEKDHNALAQKLAQLKKEFQILNSTKNRLEQELKQKDDTYNQRICSLRSENENLQLSYNEKLSLNKKLFTENDALEKEIEDRDAELNDLKNKLKDMNNQLGQSLVDKGDLENQVQKLKNIKNSQINDINKLTKENKNLSEIVKDQDNKLQKFQDEIAIMTNKSNENDADIQNLNIKLRSFMDDISNTQNVLNKNNLDNRDLDDKLRELNCQCENLKCENANLNNTILKEKSLRADKERQNQNLNNIINDHDIQINDLTDKYNTLNAMYSQATNDSKNSQIQNDKLKEHIMVLTQQNQKLLCELENVKDQDLRIKTLLSRKDQSAMILRSVHGCIEQATICLEKIENDPIGCGRNNLIKSGSSTGNDNDRNRLRSNSSEKIRTTSPRYTYVSKKDN